MTKSLLNNATLIAFISPVYWPDANKRIALCQEVHAALQPAGCDEIILVDSEEKLATIGDSLAPRIFMALSGGVQPWMQAASKRTKYVGLFNGYLPDALPSQLANQLLHANAHPASTDFYAWRRLSGEPIYWLGDFSSFEAFLSASNATQRLRSAKILKIGETEPWVINSCRSPKVIRERVGSEIIPIEREQLYSLYSMVSDQEAIEETGNWLNTQPTMIDVQRADVIKACRVTVAMKRLIASHEADGLSMACFAMIGDIGTTSCLGLSTLNASATAIGACEGDLDAALTLYLLKSLGADFVWIANPVIHQGNYVDLVHCTAPTCGCGTVFNYRLMRHHESGKGVSPEVELPGGVSACATRLSVNTQYLTAHQGVTSREEKIPACHTQIRLHIESSNVFLSSLLGTHVVLCYGDFLEQLSYCADFLGFGFTGTSYANSQTKQ